MNILDSLQLVLHPGQTDFLSLKLLFRDEMSTKD